MEQQTQIEATGAPQQAGSYVQALNAAVSGTVGGVLAGGQQQAEPTQEVQTQQEADPSTAQVEQQPEQQAGTADTAIADDAAKASTEESPEFQETLQRLAENFAKNSGIDLSELTQNPIYRATLKVLKSKAHADLHIKKLQAENRELRTPQGQKADYLSGLFGKQAQTQQQQPAQQQPPPVQQQPPMAQPPPAQQPQRILYNDIGDSWTSEEDGVNAYVEALQNGDSRRANEVQKAWFKRTFDQQLPLVHLVAQRIVQQELDRFRSQELADVLPFARQTAMEKTIVAAREDAVEGLKTDGFSEIEAFVQERDGPPIEHNNGRWPNTEFNQILHENPFLLNIVVTHNEVTGEPLSPYDRERATFYRRAEAAMKLKRLQQAGKPQQQPQVAPETARQLMQAGAQMQQREQLDRTRQAINAGPGATGLGPSKPDTTYMREILGQPLGSSLSSILRR